MVTEPLNFDASYSIGEWWVKLIFIKVFSIALISVSIAQKLVPGQVIDTVSCLHNKDQTYALYLPSGYDTTSAWPVIFIFEPGARGALPVRKYASVAEDLGYILISSNNSRNGSWDIAFDAANAMLQEATDRYVIDSQRMYTSGFSGGARVATSVAVLTKKMAGVISCGAGMPNLPHYRPARGSSLNYISLVGNRDMNYLELLLLEDVLNNIELNNKRLVFDGKHTWPPAELFLEALLWMDLQAFNQQIIGNYDLTRSFQLSEHRADSLVSAGDYLEAHRVFSDMVADFDTHMDMHKVQNAINSIENQRNFKKQTKAQARTVRLEKDYQKTIFEAFKQAVNNRLKPNINDSTAKTKQWWFTEIDRFKRMSEKGNHDRSLMAQRLLNLIWARFAESSFGHAGQGDLELASEFTKIWLYVEPDNTWGHWSMAKLYGQMEKVDLMITHLEKIRRINPKLSSRSIMNEKIFSQFTSDQRMQQFLAQLK